MKLLNESLRHTLTENSQRLQEAALRICSEENLAREVIYRAVVKTKQRYKKLVNKERATDVCISLMKQPRKHVKQSFSSVEDCIEKALAAKVVPWKPIISAVAVVLAVAMIVPTVLPDKVRTVDASGFVMEGAVALENLIEGSNVQLKNLHEPKDFGVLDSETLPDPRYEKSLTQKNIEHVRYETVTTANGVTLFFMVYVHKDEKRSECIVYEAHEDGWHEAGRFETAYFVTNMYLGQLYYEDGKDYPGRHTFFFPSRITTLPDEAGNVYILTNYRNGLQMHRYNADGTIEELDRIWLDDGRQHFNRYEDVSNDWTADIYAFWDMDTNSIEIYTQTTHLSTNEHFMENQFLFFGFDVAEEKFREIVTANEDFKTTTDGIGPDLILYDANGGYYMVSDVFMREIELDENGDYTLRYSLSYVRDGKILWSIPIDQGKSSGDRIRPCLLAKDAEGIHLMFASNRGNYCMLLDEAGEIVKKYRFYAPSTDSIRYLLFFRHEGANYYLCYINDTYLVLARVGEDGYHVRVGEYLYPDELKNTIKFEARHTTSFISGSNVLNLIAPGTTNRKDGSYPPTYFFQIVLDETAISEE